MVDEVNELRLEISDLDCVVHMWLTDNDTFDDELNAKLTKLFAGWLNVAKNIGKSTAELVGAGYGVRGIEELRTGIREVESALAPSYEMTTAMKMRLEAAQAEHTAERTIDGLFDS